MSTDPPAAFSAAGALLPAYERVDWAATSLGLVESWTPTLRAAVDTMLRTRFPVTLFWGPEFALVYNEAYGQLIGDKHPFALGAPAREVFAEAWSVIGPMMQTALTSGTATWVEDEYVPLTRHGFLEECYFTFSYSPVFGSGGRVEGIMDIAVETTDKVISARRQELLGRLSEALADVHDMSELAKQAEHVLGGCRADLPLVNLHLPGVAAVTTHVGQWLPPRPPNGILSRLMTGTTPDGVDAVWLPLSESSADPGDGSGDASAHRRPVADRGGEHTEHGEHVPMLVVRPADQLRFDRAYRLFMRLVADLVTQALARLAERAAERALHDQERAFSTALQRSLLTKPTQHDPRLQVVVRYEPATDVAQVGGDWHDAFPLPDGSLALTIGDVAGHDRDAAAAMGQARHLLRGIAYTLDESPAGVMVALDRAIVGLDVSTIATAIFARVERSPDQRQAGLRLLRWTNAGHPPPIHVDAGGAVTVLEGLPEPLLGAAVETVRSDHARILAPGDTVVLYTDGLIERRGQTIDDGLSWLTSILGEHAGLDSEQLADVLIDRMLPNATDDVAILILRAHPEG